MRYPSLTEFLASSLRNGYIRVRVNGAIFTIYVRKGPRSVDGKLYGRVLDLANIKSSRPGKGGFRKLGSLLQSLLAPLDYDGIYVESVLNERFGESLKEFGYRRVNAHYQTDNYFKEMS